ncbi:retrovirus-related Pol polyprotein from transposon TNT 1-94, partial [Trifolium medium]|nr:retrovirus-related Pol polyprotein from transposon TNT 1-94 [Trifolium medium]
MTMLTFMLELTEIVTTNCKNLEHCKYYNHELPSAPLDFKVPYTVLLVITQIINFLRSHECLFLGYSPSHKGYKCLSPSGRLYIFKDVLFNESRFPYLDLFTTSKSSGYSSSPSDILSPLHLSASPNTVISDVSPAPSLTSNDNSSPPIPVISAVSPISSPSPTENSSSAPNPIHDTLNISAHTNPPIPVNAQPVSHPLVNNHSMQTRAKSGFTQPRLEPRVLLTHNEPKTVKQALTVPHWKAAMQAEFDALQHNDTWTLVPLLPNRTAIGCRWVFRVKQNSDGSLNKYKARCEQRFFNGLLSEEVYMQQPQGFEHQDTSLVCKLNKALKCDPSLFILSSSGSVVYLLVYVDDIIITGASSALIKSIIAKLNNAFSLKHLGDLDYFLGIEVSRQSNGSLILNQTKYIRDLLIKTKMQDSIPVATPMQSSCKLTKVGSSALSDPFMYRSVVGALQYATITRPKIAFAVNKCVNLCHIPLNTTGLLSKGFLDWASDPDDRRSTSGAAIYFEILWIQTLLHELHVPSHTPLVLCDNQSAVALAHNHVLHARTKHMEIDLFFVREKVLAKQISVIHIPETDQWADLFTKPLSSAQFLAIRPKLNVASPEHPPLSL